MNQIGDDREASLKRKVTAERSLDSKEVGPFFLAASNRARRLASWLTLKRKDLDNCLRECVHSTACVREKKLNALFPEKPSDQKLGSCSLHNTHSVSIRLGWAVSFQGCVRPRSTPRSIQPFHDVTTLCMCLCFHAKIVA